MSSSTRAPQTKTLTRRIVSAMSLFLAALILSGCPKKEWHYTPPPAPTPTETFDVQFDAAHLDPNGAARNVDWHPQLSGQIPDPDACNKDQPYTPACTQNKPFLDQPDGIDEAFCFIGKETAPPYEPFFGHADWMPAQFNGSIGWFNFGLDDDYDLMIVPASDNLPPTSSGAPNEHGITTNNNHVTDDKSPQYIEMEFYSDEIDPAFAKGWWKDFRENGINDNVDALQKLMHPSQPNTLACGSAVGLFGLDCDHGCRSELHPLYGVAIQQTEDPSNNVWSIMARNWGTGGYCSRYNDELAENSLSLLLPYISSLPPISATVQDFVSIGNSSSARVSCPAIYFNNGQTILNIALPSPEQQPAAAFTLTLKWPSGAHAAACTQTAPEAAEAIATRALTPEHGNKLNGEQYMGALWHAAYQSQHPGNPHPTLERDVLSTVPETQSRMQALTPLTASAETCTAPLAIKTGPPPAPTPIQKTHPLKIDAHKQTRDQRVLKYICNSYKAKPFALPQGTTQQDLDQACKSVQ
jgi:hypothetical protein